VDDALNAAMEKAQAHLESQETETTEAVAPEPVETTATEAAPVVEAAPATETRTAAERARDEAGKFTKAPKPKPAKVAQKPAGTAPSGGVHGAASAAPPAGQVPADGAVPSPAPSVEAASPLKLPSSWKPAAREALAKAPREVQEEAVRIDREVRQVMQEAAPLKQRMSEVERTLAPFEGLARANGMDAMQYAGSVLQSAAQLFQGPPQTRAAILAQLIQQSGADLEAINAALQGQAPAAQARPAADPRAEVRRVLEEERAQQRYQESLRAAQDFLKDPPEFWEYVKEEVTSLIDWDRSKGGNLTLQQAYDRACKLNDDVQGVVSKRKEGERARTATAATQAAQAATQVSLRSSPAAAVRAKPKGLDAAARAAADKLGIDIGSR
jgi:hypothetical protein